MYITCIGSLAQDRYNDTSGVYKNDMLNGEYLNISVKRKMPSCLKSI